MNKRCSVKYRGRHANHTASLNLNLDGKDGVEYIIPDFRGNTKAEIKVLVMMGKVVLFHFFHVLREFRVMQRIVHAVIENVKCECSRNNAVSHRNREYKIGKSGHGERKEEEEWWRHDQSQPIHRQIVVDSMHQEVQCKERRSIR